MGGQQAGERDRAIDRLGEGKFGQQVDQHVERGAGLLPGRMLGDRWQLQGRLAGRAPIAGRSPAPRAAIRRRAASGW